VFWRVTHAGAIEDYRKVELQETVALRNCYRRGLQKLIHNQIHKGTIETDTAIETEEERLIQEGTIETVTLIETNVWEVY
jgi:hypothetical protein